MSKDILLKFCFIRHDNIEEHILLLDRRAMFNLAAAQTPRQDHPRDLVATLIHHGAKWQDVRNEKQELIPALQRFSVQSEHRIFLCHYRQGLRQDPSPRILAEQHFNATTGKAAMSCSHNDYNEDFKPLPSVKGKTPALPPYLRPYVLKEATPEPAL